MRSDFSLKNIDQRLSLAVWNERADAGGGGGWGLNLSHKTIFFRL